MFNTLRVVTAMLVALSMGMALAHALELGPKMTYDASTYLLLHRTLYRWFGPPVGGLIEVVAVLSSVALAVSYRGAGRPATVATLAAGLTVLAHVIWWAWVFPANNALAAMPLDAPPQNWTDWRDQWEYTHLARFVLQTASLGLLLLSNLVRPSMHARYRSVTYRAPAAAGHRRVQRRPVSHPGPSTAGDVFGMSVPEPPLPERREGRTRRVPSAAAIKDGSTL